MPVQDRTDLRRRLAGLAAQQSGYFTAAQALTAGYSYAAQAYHVQRGHWDKVDRALFRLRDWPSSPYEHLVRWSLWSRGRAVVSHETALAVHELGDVNPARIHLTVPRGFRQTAPGAILHRGDIPASDTWQQEGYRITTPLRSVLDAAAGDLALDQLASVLADALRQGVFTRRTLLNRSDGVGPHAALRVERALREVDAQ
jgi:hypothetical protein